MLTQFREGRLCFYGHCGNGHHALAGALDLDRLIPPEAVCSAEASEASLALCHVPVISADFCCPGALRHGEVCQEEMDPYSNPPPPTSSAVWKLCLNPSKTEPNGTRGLPSSPPPPPPLPLLPPPDLLNKLICCGTKPPKPSGLVGGLTTAATLTHTLSMLSVVKKPHRAALCRSN